MNATGSGVHWGMCTRRASRAACLLLLGFCLLPLHHAQALLMVPSANLNVVVQTDDDDNLFHFDIQCGQGELWDCDSFDIQTQNGTSSFLEYMSFPETNDYVVTETIPSGWSISNIECTSDTPGARFLQENAGVLISNALENSNITCIFHNTQKPKACVHGVDPTCNDNVLFIPGLEGSRLYMQTQFGEKQLWEPTFGNLPFDASALYLNSDGTSINQVYTKASSTIDTTLAGSVYGSFLNFLSQLKTSSTIVNYAAFPYDWRMSPEDVVNNGTVYDDRVHYIDQELISLAATSKTGKVTVVAHSNGGLVAKALMEKLQAEGKADLVDDIIFVDVPQLGTPLAVSGMLHGDGMELGGGWVLTQAAARQLGINMPDAYALLPSPQYFNLVAEPVVDLSRAPGLFEASGVSSTSITTYSDLSRFLTTGRDHPKSIETWLPEVLGSTLLSQATALHTNLDAWTPPAGVQVVQIAGWGLDTPVGISYVETPHYICGTFGCQAATSTEYDVNLTEDGDDTVVTPSQVINPDWMTYYINLKALNNVQSSKYSHKNITEAQPFQQLFERLLSTSSPSLPTYVSTIQPIVVASDKSIRLRTKSPVTLDVYDDQGRHTGVASSTNNLEYIEEQIPGSYYERFGEEQYVGLPAGANYSVIMHGTDNGTFTFDVTPVIGGVEQNTTSFSDIPVTVSSTVMVHLASNNLASSSLLVDLNSDGKSIETIDSAAAPQDPVTYLKLIKATVLSMDMGSVTKFHLEMSLNELGLLLESREWKDDKARADENGLFSNLSSRFNQSLHDVQKQVAIKKIDTMETYLEQQLSTEHSDHNLLSKRFHVRQLSEIDADQASAIINMVEKLKSLI